MDLCLDATIHDYPIGLREQAPRSLCMEPPPSNRLAELPKVVVTIMN
jgi:hypothetical protein